MIFHELFYSLVICIYLPRAICSRKGREKEMMMMMSIFCYLKVIQKFFQVFSVGRKIFSCHQVLILSFFLFFSSQTGCVVLHLVLHYFLLTNYAWMLCEGFYLHTVLVSAFISEQKLVRWLIVLGWSLPAKFLILYGMLRGFVADEEDRNMYVNYSLLEIFNAIKFK